MSSVSSSSSNLNSDEPLRSKLSLYFETKRLNHLKELAKKRPLIMKFKRQLAKSEKKPTLNSSKSKLDTKTKLAAKPIRKTTFSPLIKLKPKPNLIKKSAVKFEPKKIVNDEDDDVINEDEDIYLKAKPRVERFLSIVEIPQEILYYTQQKFGGLAELGEENEDTDQENQSDEKKDAPKKDGINRMENIAEEDSDLDENQVEEKAIEKIPVSTKLPEIVNKNNKTLCDKKSKKKTVETVKFYYNGSTLSQQAKAQIIKNIIDNYDLDKYLNEFKSKYYVDIIFDKNKPDFRPARQRLLKLMKSDVIKINDYGYMSELSNKIEELQLENQENIIKSLEEREIKRQRKLIIKGHIDKPYDDECENLVLLNPDSTKTSKIHSAKSSSTPFRLPKIN